MIEPMKIGALCAEKGVTSKHFYDTRHALIFDALFKAWIEGKSLDAITLVHSLKNTGSLQDAGGFPYITELSTFPTHWNAANYLEIVVEKFILRQVWITCSEYSGKAMEDGAEPSLVSDMMGQLSSITSTSTISKPKTPKEIAMDSMVRAEERIEKRGLSDGTMKTGFKNIDDAMSGIRLGDFILISGKEKSGKTTLAFNIFENIVFSQGKRAQVISLEMKLPEMSDRLLASMSKVSLTNILNGWMEDCENMRFTASMQRLSNGKFQIRDDVYSLPQIIGALRQYKAEFPDFELAVIDYLQLVDAEKEGKDNNREQVIAKTSRTLRRAAGELNIAILMLVQLNEDGQVRESRAPGMDCTAHIRLEPGNEDGQKWARIVYQRNGPSNVGIPLAHLGHFVRFEPGSFEAPQPEQKKRR